MSRTTTKPMTARSVGLKPRAGTGYAETSSAGVWAAALWRAAAPAGVGRGGGVGGSFFPTIVAARFHSVAGFCPASPIPTTAPHFEQKAWSAASAAPHF